MKSILFTLVFFMLAACSPYKKVTVTASERLTKNWQGSPEQSVSKAYGSYKAKNIIPEGYVIRFDYSYLNVIPIEKASAIHVQASGQQSSPMLPAPPKGYNDHKTPDDSVVRWVDFYFDKTQHVHQVIATGFPDSVYYIKRK